MNKRKTNTINQVLERKFQKNLIKEIKEKFPNCIVCKMDANYMQGIPDLLILMGNTWASLEVKRDQHAPHRPNQDYYVNLMNKMSFSRFIFPQNKEKVLNEMESAFKSCR